MRKVRRRTGMLRKMLTTTLAVAALAAGVGPHGARAQVSGDIVRIGVLNDQSTVFAANGGVGSVIAARLAAEDFGGRILGRPIEIVAADHQNRPDIASA